MFNHLQDKDIAGLVFIISMLSVLFILPSLERAKYRLKKYINKKLAPHGLRLKSR